MASHRATGLSIYMHTKVTRRHKKESTRPPPTMVKTAEHLMPTQHTPEQPPSPHCKGGLSSGNEPQHNTHVHIYYGHFPLSIGRTEFVLCIDRGQRGRKGDDDSWAKNGQAFSLGLTLKTFAKPLHVLT